MSERAFLDAIIAEPDEDAHRLVFADWLEEHGQSDRAEFIRTQCALARMPESDPRRTDLEVRERQLLAAHAAEWAAPWTHSGGNRESVEEGPRTATFHRGFLESMEQPAYPTDSLFWRQEFGAIFAAHPIRELNLTGIARGAFTLLANRDEL